MCASSDAAAAAAASCAAIINRYHPNQHASVNKWNGAAMGECHGSDAYGRSGRCAIINDNNVVVRNNNATVNTWV